MGEAVNETLKERMKRLLSEPHRYEEPKTPSQVWQDEGEAAYRAGTKVTANPYKGKPGAWDWEAGWKSAEAAKVAAFHDYVKVRTLHDQRYVPPQHRGSASMEFDFQRRRKVKMEQHETRYPDFPAAFTRLKQQNKS